MPERIVINTGPLVALGLETIVWENGADFPPEFLNENMKVLA
jgi:hypothetical protein